MYRTLLEEILLLEKIQEYETELWTVLCVLFFNIIAHGYRFVNLMFNGDSLLIYQTDQNWKYSIGRIFSAFLLEAARRPGCPYADCHFGGFLFYSSPCSDRADV